MRTKPDSYDFRTPRCVRCYAPGKHSTLSVCAPTLEVLHCSICADCIGDLTEWMNSEKAQQQRIRRRFGGPARRAWRVFWARMRG